MEESLAKNHYTGHYTTSLNHLRRADEESYSAHGLPDAAAAPDPDPSDGEYELSDEDSRELVQRQVRERRGQQTFRNELLNRYENRCVVTGCTVVAVLEAAHIRPYRRPEDNDVQNGLLLRADIHTLFDLNLLGIEPGTWQIHIHPRIKENYTEFDGQTLLLPPGAEPSAKAVQSRLEHFRENLSGE
ncbi:MAG: HNH endonuclease signature motif containing protein [Planctomycetaceae bacterium]